MTRTWWPSVIRWHPKICPCKAAHGEGPKPDFWTVSARLCMAVTSGAPGLYTPNIGRHMKLHQKSTPLLHKKWIHSAGDPVHVCCWTPGHPRAALEVLLHKAHAARAQRPLCSGASENQAQHFPLPHKSPPPKKKDCSLFLPLKWNTCLNPYGRAHTVPLPPPASGNQTPTPNHQNARNKASNTEFVKVVLPIT